MTSSWKRISRLSGVLAIAAAAVAIAAFVVSSRPDPAARPNSTEEVESRVMSPFCPGVLLADCPTEEAVRLRQRINERVQGEWTNSQIDNWLVESYGQRVLAAPRTTGVWLVPAAWVVAGIALVTLLAARWAGRMRSEPSKELAVGPDDSERIEAELRSFAEGSTE